MERLVLKYKTAQRALHSLARAIENKKKGEQLTSFLMIDKDETINMLNDSLIQRFEYCFDITWKYLEKYLLVVLGVPLAVKTPAAVFRTLLKTEFFTDVQIHQAMKMLEDRNTTTHLYHQKLAEVIVEYIPRHYELMRLLLDRTKIE